MRISSKTILFLILTLGLSLQVNIKNPVENILNVELDDIKEGFLKIS